MKAKTLYITVGSTDLTSQNLDYIGVDQIIVHPDYLGLNLWPTNDDIALVQLESAPGNEAISIPRWKSTPEEGETVTVAGWGRTDVDTSSDESELREADMVVRTENRCHPWYDSNTHIDGKESAIRLDHDLIACAGGTAENVTQACFGDSGSPMFVTRQDGEIVQAGIVSGGWGDCGTGGIPALYTKVAAYQSWIRSEMTPTSLYKGGSDEVKITAEEDQADWVNMKNFSSSTATLDVGEIARYRLPETSRVRVKTLRGNTGLIVYDHWSMDQNDIVCSADTEWSNAYHVDPGEGEGEWEICDLDSEGTYFARVISWDDSRYRIRKD